MHSAPQPNTSVDDTGVGTPEGQSDPVKPPLRPLLSFLRRPAFATSAPGQLSARHWLGWVGLLLLVGVLGGALDRILVLALHWPVPARSVWAQFVSHPSWAAGVVLLVAPAMEELGFRALLSTAPKLVFTGLAVFPAYLLLFIHNDITPVTAPTSPLAMLSRYLHAFWIILPAGGINLLLYRYQRDLVVSFFRRRAAWIFWVSCIVFGAGHNLYYANSPVWWAFVLVMPQFLIGIGLAYVRVNFGLRWSIASHYAYDWLVALPSWLYFSARPTAPLHGLLPMFMAVAVLLAIMTYGVVVLRRVVLLRW